MRGGNSILNTLTWQYALLRLDCRGDICAGSVVDCGGNTRAMIRLLKGADHV